LSGDLAESLLFGKNQMPSHPEETVS